MRAAAACGLEKAVESNAVIYVRKLADEGTMDQFVAGIKPGMIVSLQMSRPVPITYSKKKGPDKPAIDKKPTITDKNTVPGEDITTVEIVKRLCGKLKNKGFTVVTVNMLEKMAAGQEAAAKVSDGLKNDKTVK